MQFSASINTSSLIYIYYMIVHDMQMLYMIVTCKCYTSRFVPKRISCECLTEEKELKTYELSNFDFNCMFQGCQIEKFNENCMHKC